MMSTEPNELPDIFEDDPKILAIPLTTRLVAHAINVYNDISLGDEPLRTTKLFYQTLTATLLVQGVISSEQVPELLDEAEETAELMRRKLVAARAKYAERKAVQEAAGDAAFGAETEGNTQLNTQAERVNDGTIEKAVDTAEEIAEEKPEEKPEEKQEEKAEDDTSAKKEEKVEEKIKVKEDKGNEDEDGEEKKMKDEAEKKMKRAEEKRMKKRKKQEEAEKMKQQQQQQEEADRKKQQQEEAEKKKEQEEADKKQQQEDADKKKKKQEDADKKTGTTGTKRPAEDEGQEMEKRAKLSHVSFEGFCHPEHGLEDFKALHEKFIARLESLQITADDLASGSLKKLLVDNPERYSKLSVDQVVLTWTFFSELALGFPGRRNFQDLIDAVGKDIVHAQSNALIERMQNLGSTEGAPAVLSELVTRMIRVEEIFMITSRTSVSKNPYFRLMQRLRQYEAHQLYEELASVHSKDRQAVLDFLEQASGQKLVPQRGHGFRTLVLLGIGRLVGRQKGDEKILARMIKTEEFIYEFVQNFGKGFLVILSPHLSTVVRDLTYTKLRVSLPTINTILGPIFRDICQEAERRVLPAIVEGHKISLPKPQEGKSLLEMIQSCKIETPEPFTDAGIAEELRDTYVGELQ